MQDLKRHISIRLLSDGYCVISNGMTKLRKASATDQTSYHDMLQKELANAVCEEIVVALAPENTCVELIPADFWNAMRQNSAMSEQHAILCDFIENDNAYLRYYLPKRMVEILKNVQTRDNTSIRHQLSVMLLRHYDGVYAIYEGDTLFVVVRDHAIPLLVNAFRATTPEDVAYYVLNVYNQLNIRVEQPLTLKAPANVHSLLSQYINVVIDADNIG